MRPLRDVYSIDLNITKNLVDLGRCVAVVYASTKTGKFEHYEHKFGSGARLLATEDGKTLIIAGKKIKTTDWIRG